MLTFLNHNDDAPHNIPSSWLSLNNNNNFPLKFIAESCHGKLAKHLRILGCDVLCEPDFSRNYIIYLARSQNRIILTSSTQLVAQLKKLNAPPKHNPKSYEIYPSSDDEDDDDEDNVNNDEDADQLQQVRYFFVHKDKNTTNTQQFMQVVQFFKIRFDPNRVYSICVKCAQPLTLIPVNPQTMSEEDRQLCKKFEQEMGKKCFDMVQHTLRKCTNCNNKLYWEGKHFGKLVQFAKRYSYCCDDNSDESGESDYNNSNAINIQQHVTSY